MTSDAKIGLLLGLVFIFVIAFIINGLPNLRPQTTHADVLKNVVTFPEENMGVAGQAQAQTDRDWNALVDQQETAVETAQPAVEQPGPVVDVPAPQSGTADSQDVRFESPLPRIEDLLHRINAGLLSQREQASAVDVEPSSAPEQPAPAERQPTVQAPEPRPAVTPSQTVTRTTEPPRPPVTATLTRPAGKIYVVGEGESLSSVAKKVYGAEEGNRIVNINRIFEANKDILKSVHEVVAGQKLVIPPLPKPTINPNKPSDVLRGELFEKVEALGRRTAPAAPAASPEGRWYTVQDGDNLWKIASSQLGAGARYEEIAKLNADLLKDREKLDVGMKIRLPLK